MGIQGSEMIMSEISLGCRFRPCVKAKPKWLSDAGPTTLDVSVHLHQGSAHPGISCSVRDSL